MLGKRVTTEISQKELPENFLKSRAVARRGGRVAGVARMETKRELRRSVATPENFLEKDDSGIRRRISSGKTE